MFEKHSKCSAIAKRCYGALLGPWPTLNLTGPCLQTQILHLRGPPPTSQLYFSRTPFGESAAASPPAGASQPGLPAATLGWERVGTGRHLCSLRTTGTPGWRVSGQNSDTRTWGNLEPLSAGYSAFDTSLSLSGPWLFLFPPFCPPSAYTRACTHSFPGLSHPAAIQAHCTTAETQEEALAPSSGRTPMKASSAPGRAPRPSTLAGRYLSFLAVLVLKWQGQLSHRDSLLNTDPGPAPRASDSAGLGASPGIYKSLGVAKLLGGWWWGALSKDPPFPVEIKQVN